MDKDGMSFRGVGMYTLGGTSGIAYAKYNIPDSTNRFTTHISLDSVWCGTSAYGTSTFQIFFDDVMAFSESYTETFSARLIDIQIPQNAKTITLQVSQDASSEGNHACFFGSPLIS